MQLGLDFSWVNSCGAGSIAVGLGPSAGSILWSTPGLSVCDPSGDKHCLLGATLLSCSGEEIYKLA